MMNFVRYFLKQWLSIIGIQMSFLSIIILISHMNSDIRLFLNTKRLFFVTK